MRLKSEQLPAHLNRAELLPVYYVSGDEPMQLQEAGDLVRARARELGHEERVVLDVETGFDWGRLQEAGANLSLFSQQTHHRTPAWEATSRGGKAARPWPLTRPAIHPTTCCC